MKLTPPSSLLPSLLAAALWLPLAASAQPAPPTQGAAAPVQAATAAMRAAPPVDLRVTYHTRTIGRDGVLRQATHTNHVHRRVGMVWTERELPAALLQSQGHGHDHDHGPHAGHAHDEANGAPLLVRRSDDGQEKVEVILAKTRRVIEVDRAHHGNVGYGGSWDTQYWLVPPAALQRMERLGPPKAGVQRYRQVQGEATTTVDWDMAGQYPRRIERSDAHGTEITQVTATRLPTPAVAPWKASESFDRGDYSDLLD
ncbi:hypothetical protein [Diaphorobacter nitroreducens]|uniref:hypothetical protein n=1 Tax=Diaphorobacter nitroreducens TaxID=164759 RepID=UPI000DB793F0|nr:hypothetical protein [Diaphorobacter nitroreducens]PZU37073.1 MAG: hypothetical protein DI574_10300 [Acidovorax sp.]